MFQQFEYGFSGIPQGPGADDRGEETSRGTGARSFVRPGRPAAPRLRSLQDGFLTSRRDNADQLLEGSRKKRAGHMGAAKQGARPRKAVSRRRSESDEDESFESSEDEEAPERTDPG